MQRTQTKTEQTKLKSKGKADGTRRYEDEVFPTYHNEYTKLAKSSSIIKDSKRSLNSRTLNDLGECKRALMELEGAPGKDGYYLQGNTAFKALIPSVKETLKDVHQDFKNWQAEQVQNGNALIPPETWPENHLKERLKAEAKLDVRRAEKAKVEARMEELKAQQRKDRKKGILPNGPLGIKAGGGPSRYDPPLSGMDGQSISHTEEGIPFIDEPDSPYHGMTVFHYRKMCKAWKKEMGITLDQLRLRRDELFYKKKVEAAEADEEIPTKKMVVTNHTLPEWMNRLGITKENWPEWPEDAEPINEIDN